MNTSQLNPFEIKSELSSLINKLGGVQNFDEYQLHFKVLDEQEDKSIILKLLFKELLNVNENTPIIKYLLIRYCDKTILNEKLWSLIKSSITPNVTKIVALDILRDISSDWSYEDCENYLDNPDELIDEDTKRLLTNAIINPEVQIDFLDFLNSLDEKDKLTLITSLADDYSQDELANILVPVFLSNLENEIGKKALELLGTSKSRIAFYALNSMKDVASDEISFYIKKSLSTLKLSGIREGSAKEFYSKMLAESQPYRFCATFPDGMGNISLVFSRRQKGGKIKFVAVVVNDYYGIKDCFGFNEISKFECDTIISRFYKQEKSIELSPQIMKGLLEYFEKISGYSKLPYEYICWKNILSDIESENFDLEEILKKEIQPLSINNKIFEELMQENFIDYWFLSSDYSDEVEEFLKNLNLKFHDKIDFDIDEYLSNNVEKVFYSEEKEIWQKRLLMSAFLLLNDGQKELSQKFYGLYVNEKFVNEFLKFVLKKSIYEYYLTLKHSQNEIFTNDEIDKIINLIEEKWVIADV